MGASVAYFTVNAAGAKGASHAVDVQAPQMMHDFAVTENYAAFMDHRLGYDKKHMLRGNSVPFRYVLLVFPVPCAPATSLCDIFCQRCKHCSTPLLRVCDTVCQNHHDLVGEYMCSVPTYLKFVRMDPSVEAQLRFYAKLVQCNFPSMHAGRT